jgi:hypothetical protein
MLLLQLMQSLAEEYKNKVRAECFELANYDSDLNKAIMYLQYAVACEGDFCGWIDYRVYNQPLNLIKKGI